MPEDGLGPSKKGPAATARTVLSVDPDALKALCENKKARTIALSCVEWFNAHQDKLHTFLRTVRRQEAFSLRIIDWTTTNYSKRHRITIYHRGLPTDLHNDYRRFLGVFTKKYFDPFARRERIKLLVHGGRGGGGDDDDPPGGGGAALMTTVGQLNFMRWMLERNVHVAVQQLRATVELDMRDYDGRRHHPVPKGTAAGSAPTNNKAMKSAATAKARPKQEERILVYQGSFRLNF